MMLKILIIFLIGILLLVLISYWEHKVFVVSRHEVSSPKIPKDFNDTSILIISDLHNHIHSKGHMKLISEINKISPDYIFIAGDMVVKNQEDFPKEAFYLLENLGENYEIYYGYGNHEKHNENDFIFIRYREKLEDIGVKFLNNEEIKLYKNNSYINLTGLDLDIEYYRRNGGKRLTIDEMNEIMPVPEPDIYQIVIAHHPDYYQIYSQWGADLILSGHIHGGIVRLPFIGGLISTRLKLFPKYDSGHFKDFGSSMIVSRGLGSHTIKFRIFNKPELILIELKQQSKGEKLYGHTS